MNAPINQSKFGDKYKSNHDAIFAKKPETEPKPLVCPLILREQEKRG